MSTGATGRVAALHGVSKTYVRGPERVRALVDVSLHLGPGEVVALSGPSGSGKTTLLNVLLGWEAPDAGDVEVLGRPLPDHEPGWAEVAVVPQRLGLIEELTVAENVALPLRLGEERSVDNGSGRVGALLDALGLADLAARMPPETSLGQQQRTALARALVARPALLVADEPTGHQDEESADAVLRLLHAAADEGMACLLATHATELTATAHRVVALLDGMVVA